MVHLREDVGQVRDGGDGRFIAEDLELGDEAPGVHAAAGLAPGRLQRRLDAGEQRFLLGDDGEGVLGKGAMGVAHARQGEP
ncbi:hypothetical protein ACLESD_38750 [Pyxidicoccus sp. 3LFB2]